VGGYRRNGTNFAYNKNNTENVVDGKIEIDCLIRGIANGFLSFFFFPGRDYNDRVAKRFMYEYVPPEAMWSSYESQPQGSRPKECGCLKARPIFHQVQRSLPIQIRREKNIVYVSIY